MIDKDEVHLGCHIVTCAFLCNCLHLHYYRHSDECETVPDPIASPPLSFYTTERASSPPMACRYPFSSANAAVARFFYPSTLSISTRSTTPLFCPPVCRIRVRNTSRMLASSSSAASEDPKSKEGRLLESLNAKDLPSEPGPNPHDVSSAPSSFDFISEGEEISSGQVRKLGSSSSSSSTSSSKSSTNSVSSKNAPLKFSSTYSFPSNISVPPEVREHLTEWSKNVLNHSRHVIQEAQKKFVGLGLKVNEMTGYHEVERLKHMVFEKGMAFLPRP